MIMVSIFEKVFSWYLDLEKFFKEVELRVCEVVVSKVF